MQHAHPPLLVFDDHVVHIVHVFCKLGGQKGRHVNAIELAYNQVPAYGLMHRRKQTQTRRVDQKVTRQRHRACL
jgi:hypothetical protein